MRDLQAIRDDLSGHYRLSCDIDAAETREWNDGTGFQPLGSNAPFKPFTGTLDGAGHTISCLAILRESEDYVGLFASVWCGVISNLTLASANVAGRDCVGILAGRMSGVQASGQKCKVSNVHVSGRIKGRSLTGSLVGSGGQACIVSDCTVDATVAGTNEQIGGLAGNLYDVIVTDCRVRSDCAGLARVGGLSGSTEGQGWTRIEQCETAGKVAGQKNVGGLIGQASVSRIERCRSCCAVAGSGDNIGGLLGFAFLSSVKDSYSSGTVQVRTPKAFAIGGLVGALMKGPGLLNCYTSVEILPPSLSKGASGLIGFVQHEDGSLPGKTSSYWDVGKSGVQPTKDFRRSDGEMSSSFGTGEGKTSTEMTKRETFQGWDFESIWKINEGMEYPILRCFDRITATGSR